MIIVIFILVAAAMGAIGYYRGAIRLCLTLFPMLFTSLLLWLLGPTFYRFDSLRNAGLFWPGIILIVIGVGVGYGLQFLCRKKISRTIQKNDRFSGLALGLFLSFIVVWSGCVYYVIWSAQNQPQRDTSSAGWLAERLNSSIVRWIPGLGQGSDAMMSMVEIATAKESARRQAIKDLGYKRLVDLPQMQAIFDDQELHTEIESASKGDFTAIWRLQKHPLILKLLETDEFTTILSSLSIHDLAQAVRNAK